MKNILKKGSKFFLTALVILNSLMNTLPVHAEETTTDENDLDKIVELGNAEDVFPDLMPQSDGISLTDTTGTGSIIRILQNGMSYLKKLVRISGRSIITDTVIQAIKQKNTMSQLRL